MDADIVMRADHVSIDYDIELGVARLRVEVSTRADAPMAALVAELVARIESGAVAERNLRTERDVAHREVADLAAGGRATGASDWAGADGGGRGRGGKSGPDGSPIVTWWA